MSNNQRMLHRAKHESEVIFRNCLCDDNVHYVHFLNKNVEFADIVQMTCIYNIDDGNDCASKALDCKYHVDVQAKGIWHDSNGNEKITIFHFDVEDVEDKNIVTRNYTLPVRKVQFFEKTTDAYYLVFRCNDGISQKLNKFIVVDAKELCSMKNAFEDHGAYFLVPLVEIEKCVDTFEVNGDF